MTDIFLSYAHEDFAKAKQLAVALEKQGWSMFWDKTSLLAGDDFEQVIEKEIAQARCMIVAWSKASKISNWVRGEAAIGLERNILVPIFFDSVDPPIAFRSLQTENFADWNGDFNSDEFIKLHRSITRLAGSRAVTDKTVNSPNFASSPNQENTNTLPLVDTDTLLNDSEQAATPDFNKSNPTEAISVNSMSDSDKTNLSEINESVSIYASESKSSKLNIIILSALLAILIYFSIYRSSENIATTVSNTPSINYKNSKQSHSIVLEKEVKGFKKSSVDHKNTKQPRILEPEMVRIPSGIFQMGSNGYIEYEEPVHLVKLNSFSIGRFEVTFDEYDQYVADVDKPRPDDNGWGRGKRPVINVSWENAVAYTKWLSVSTGHAYRLPTEAEWEYAARANTMTDFYWGNYYWWQVFLGHKEAKKNAWFLDNKTYPVGEKNPNAFGLYDMAGNVSEWVQDCWHGNYQDAPTDGKAWLEQNNGNCTLRIERGGTWFGYPDYLRSAYRYWTNPDDHGDTLGFRLAQDLP